MTCFYIHYIYDFIVNGSLIQRYYKEANNGNRLQLF